MEIIFIIISVIILCRTINKTQDDLKTAWRNVSYEADQKKISDKYRADGYTMGTPIITPLNPRYVEYVKETNDLYEKYGSNQRISVEDAIKRREQTLESCKKEGSVDEFGYCLDVFGNRYN